MHLWGNQSQDILGTAELNPCCPVHLVHY